MPAATDEEIIGLTVNYQDQLNAIADAAGRIARQVWFDLPGTDREHIGQFIDDARPVVFGARGEAIDLTSAYLHELTGQIPRAVDLKLGDPRWSDPFLRTWRELSKGKGWDQARLSGATQAQAVAIDVVQSGAIGRMTQNGIVGLVGFRRVPQPGACDWCRLVSTQRYHSAETAAFGHGKGKHNACHCTVVAIYGKRDPGRVINRTRLAELKQEGVVARVGEAKRRQRERQTG